MLQSTTGSFGGLVFCLLSAFPSSPPHPQLARLVQSVKTTTATAPAVPTEAQSGAHYLQMALNENYCSSRLRELGKEVSSNTCSTPFGKVARTALHEEHGIRRPTCTTRLRALCAGHWGHALWRTQPPAEDLGHSEGPSTPSRPPVLGSTRMPVRTPARSPGENFPAQTFPVARHCPGKSQRKMPRQSLNCTRQSMAGLGAQSMAVPPRTGFYQSYCPGRGQGPRLPPGQRPSRQWLSPARLQPYLHRQNGSPRAVVRPGKAGLSRWPKGFLAGLLLKSASPAWGWTVRSVPLGGPRQDCTLCSQHL